VVIIWKIIDWNLYLTETSTIGHEESSLSGSTKEMHTSFSHTTSSTTTTVNACLCDCSKMQNYVTQDNVTLFDVNDLKIDKTSLSSTIRKKTSASDPRHSSLYIGCVGIVVTISVPLFILILDMLPRAKP
jgi:hypothetical protein